MSVTAVKEERPKPEAAVKAEERSKARQKARQAGRLWRVKHYIIGQSLVTAKDEAEAITRFAEERCPADARNKEWAESFAKQCRVSKLPPSAEAI